eukprot:GGOE01036547.1.p1 GENE.GGOE01036547.1~~GGOE01036547.1.p1  ORF type:complete len:207 (-),score=48.46 GGOE01036547.1:204-824(-)
MPLLRANRTGDGAAPDLVEEAENVLHTFTGIKLFVGTVLLGTGTLFCTNRNVYWLHASAPLRDARVDARGVMVHALDLGAAVLPDPNVYCQLDIGEELLESDDEEEEGGDGRPFKVTEAQNTDVPQLMAKACEVRFTCAGCAQAEELFAAFSEVVQLNPDDPDDSDEEEAFRSGGQAMQRSGSGRGRGGEATAEPPGKRLRTNQPS